MAETFTPKTWIDGSGGGTPIIAADLNRVEQGVESMDDRVTALEASAPEPLVHTVGNSGTALAIDASSASGWIKTITLTGACTFTLSGATSGRATTLELILTQDGTGSRVVTWPASVKWSGGAPTLSIAAAAVDRVVLVSYNAGTTWYADLVGKGYV